MGIAWKKHIGFSCAVVSYRPVAKLRQALLTLIFHITNVDTCSQDVMVVGEPTLMGGEFGDEDERLITRLENTQYDAANGMDDDEDFNNSPALGNNSPWNSKPPTNQETKSENPTPQTSQ